MNNIKINNPWLLVIIVPLIAAIIVGFFMLPKQKRKRPKNIISLSLHIVMAVLLGLAFADIQFLNSSTDTELYIVCDVSDSESNNVEKIDSVVSDIKDQVNGTAKIGVICFGKDQYTLVRPGSGIKSVSEMFDDNKHSDFDRSCSDIAAALDYTYKAFSENSIKRVVLVSDGLETDQSALDEVDTLISNNVAIDACGITSTFSNEAGITSIEYTQYCFLGRDEKVKVMVQTTKEQKITLKLTSGGKVIDTLKNETASKGLNTYSLTCDSSKTGAYDYEVTLEATTDTYADNNKKSFTQEYTDKFNVLFVANTETELTNFKALNLYSNSENTKIDSYINKANVPYRMSDLLKYDEIVYSGINISSLNHAETLANNLSSYVKVYGKSFLTFGATYSGTGEDYISTYNDMLPVQYESDDTRALALIIDVSSSMSTSDRIGKAKQGAIKCLELLDDDDFVTVVTFGSTTTIVQSLTSAKNKTAITNAINRITASGSTTMAPGLTEAYKQLQGANVDYKQAITLSDGQPSDSGKLERVVKIMAANDIVCTFINISNQSGETLLKKLAEAGNGSYYFVRSAANLVDTLLTSVSEELYNTKVEETTAINIKDEDDPAISGISYLVDIEGYNYCRLKAAATTVLTVQYQEKDKDGEVTGIATVPLYAHWTYGKGNVGSFTSNLDDWTSKFRSSSNGKTFLQQAAKDILPASATDEALDLQYTNNGYTTTVTISPNDGDKSGKMLVKVTSPSNDTKDYELYFDGSGFTGTINTTEEGKYSVQATYQQKNSDGNYETSATATLPLYFDYSKEYDLASEDNDLLYNITKRSQGNYGTNTVEIDVSSASIAFMSYISTMFIFLIIAIVLFLVDVFVRKSDIRRHKNKADVISGK